jgi:hypothetical protein
MAQKPTKTAAGNPAGNQQAQNNQRQAAPPPPPPVSDMDWGQESGAGFEFTKPEDFGIPFLVILQKGSPEVDPDHKDYATKKIAGAQAGMIMNTLARKIVFDPASDPLQFIPCSFIKLYQEWRPREQGGGFVMSHKNASILTTCTRNEKNQDILPNGNTIITTSYFQGLYMDTDEWVWKQAIVAMSSTQLKKARSWLNTMSSIRMNGITPPMYSHVYAITTVAESNQKGNWRGWKIELLRPLMKEDNEVVAEARLICRNSSEQNQKLIEMEPATQVDDNM